MKTLHKGFTALVLLTAVAVGATMVSGNAWAYRGGNGGGQCGCEGRDGGWKGHGQPGDRMAKALDLTKEQTEQVKAIFLKHRDETASLRKAMMSERRELRTLTQAEKADEAAIREQAKKIAATTGDLAVRRASIAREVRAVLTPEQIRKFRTLQEKRDRRIDGMMKRGQDWPSKGE
ncbi:MAG: periplasmic heavy metal sensor [Deltaproteobacteria bacterium]|nr:MAG: periplasmic heavy metal sensor [Deltaproteobacteria bacterium]